MTTAHRGSPSPSISRSLLSRIASPFSVKPKNISDFHIRPDEPHRQYSPGDVVKGSVLLTVNRPTLISHIVICLYGFVKVYKSANAPGQGISKDGGFLGPGRGKRGIEYFGNGFASIFEDEIVLCGDGRLDTGVYDFKFELDFPSSGIPSSIDFERGTISYMLTSTLTRPPTMTRPTAVGATMTCDRKIYLVETMDIASLRHPKLKVITLEPITRRSKARASHKVHAPQSNTQQTTQEANALIEERPPSPSSTIPRTSEDPPQSPVPSEISSGSALSGVHLNFRIGTNSPLVKSSKASDTRSSAASTLEKTITATTELSHSGCLPGDIIPVKISIDHTKPIKSLQGIIVTLYRLGRIDTHPAMPLGTYSKGKKPEYEDYYPKSRTGLGGLSLSSAGSSHVFRMDLAQTFAPLIIDPQTLIATINTSVRVPDNAFPTISNVPGAMISFNYFLEVVMDLRGKLAGQDRILPRLANNLSNQDYTGPVSWREGGILQVQNANFADTDQIRRDKSVVACIFEIVLGTRDSKRKAVKRLESTEGQFPIISQPDKTYDQSAYGTDEQALFDERTRFVRNIRENDDDGSRLDSIDSTGLHLTTQTNQYWLESLSQTEVQEELDEKTQIRRAEERLLPSAPAIESSSSLSAQPLSVPSAPPLSLLHDEYSANNATSPAYEGPSRSFLETRTQSTGNNYRILTDSFRQNVSGDDKEELEHQRLLVAASAPGDDAYEEHVGSSSRTQAAFPAPSAPVFEDDHEEHQALYISNSHPDLSSRFTTDHPREGAEPLPRYQK